MYKQAFVRPGASNIIDAVHPETGLSFYSGETLEQIQKRYPGAEIVDFEDWCAEKAKLQDSEILWSEIDEERYFEALECLPPEIMWGSWFLIGEAYDHHAGDGTPRFSACKISAGKYYESSRPMRVSEFREHYTKGKAAAQEQKFGI